MSFSQLLSNADKCADARTIIKHAITHDAQLGLLCAAGDASLPPYCHLHNQFVDNGRMMQAHCLDGSFICVCSRVTRGMQLFSCRRSWPKWAKPVAGALLRRIMKFRQHLDTSPSRRAAANWIHRRDLFSRRVLQINREFRAPRLELRTSWAAPLTSKSHDVAHHR